jgi:nucleoid DNA-binding protein
VVTKTSFPRKRSKGPRVGRDVVATLVRQALNLSSDREADNVVNVVTGSIVTVIRENIDTNGFVLKLPSFGKFEVRHKTGKLRKIPLTGKVQMTADKRKVKFTGLSEFRELERIPTE